MAWAKAANKSTLSATYVGSRGIDLFRSVDANAPLPPNYSGRPDLNLGLHREMQSEGYLKSSALEVTFRSSPTKFLTGQVQYTVSKTENNTSGIMFFPGNSYNPKADWGLADNNRRPSSICSAPRRQVHLRRGALAVLRQAREYHHRQRRQS